MIGFNEAFEFVIGQEGGYVLNPKDPGGETNFGISKRSYPHLDIKSLTKEAVKPIYQRDFWDQLHCGEMPGALAFLVFNAATNQGQPSAAMILQAALGTKIDGIIGPATMAAINHADVRPCCRRFVVYQILRYIKSTVFSIFGFSWLSRTLLAFETSITSLT